MGPIHEGPAGHARATKSVAFSDDDRLVSAGSDGKILWWMLDAEKLSAAVEELGIEELTEEEERRVADLLGR